MRSLMNFEEWSLAWLAGMARAARVHTANQTQLEGAKRRVLDWGIDPAR